MKTENPQKNVGMRLKTFLRIRFDKMLDAEKSMGISSGNFSPYMRGESKLGSGMLTWLAEQGCNINWLLTGEGAMLRDDEEERHRLEQRRDVLRETKGTYIANAGAPELAGAVIIAAEIKTVDDHTIVIITPTGERIMVVTTTKKKG
jgi:hypothetical protein